MNAKFISVLHYRHNWKAFVFISLLFMSVLFSSGFIFTFNTISPLVPGASDKIVSNETELRDAISNAPTKKSFTIALNNDITLTETLIIPTNKNIVLTSNKATEDDYYYKLIGDIYKEPSHSLDLQTMVRVSTITVNAKGTLALVGIVVTHTGSNDHAVTVEENGQFMLHNGLISKHMTGIVNNGLF